MYLDSTKQWSTIGSRRWNPLSIRTIRTWKSLNFLLVTHLRIVNQKLNQPKDFLDALPKLESHYCRASSSRLYLEPMWTTKSQLYSAYVDDWCKNRNIKPISIALFYHAMSDKNVSLFRPKKDQCDICESYRLKNTDEITYTEHLKRKEDARQEKMLDKDKDYVFTMDLQSLLLTPKNNSSLLYYRSKLAVHNFKIFNIKTRDAYCFIWNETEGGLCANEFSSIIFHFIESQLPLQNDAKKITFYSDGCNYQNRNSTLANTLLFLSNKHSIEIEQKYLETYSNGVRFDALSNRTET